MSVPALNSILVNYSKSLWLTKILYIIIAHFPWDSNIEKTIVCRSYLYSIVSVVSAGMIKGWAAWTIGICLETCSSVSPHSLVLPHSMKRKWAFFLLWLGTLRRMYQKLSVLSNRGVTIVLRLLFPEWLNKAQAILDLNEGNINLASG